MLSVSLVFAVNDLLALRAFNTFLNNYLIHEKPSWLHKWAMKASKIWIQRYALKIFNEIRTLIQPDSINVALNDCSVGMFSVLALANDSLCNPKMGEELFLAIAATELAFNKLQKPRPDSTYK